MNTAICSIAYFPAWSNHYATTVVGQTTSAGKIRHNRDNTGKNSPPTRNRSITGKIQAYFVAKINAMKTSVLISVLLIICCIRLHSQSIPPDSLYLGQTPPGNNPKIFTLPVDSGFFAAERIAISNGGDEIYYSEVKGYYPINTPKIKMYKYSGGRWTGPSNLFEGYLAAGLSFTGDTMFFQNASSAYETFISVRNGQYRGAPKRILPSFNSAHYCQRTALGNYYISTSSGAGLGANDCCRLKINGGDTTTSSLGLPLNNSADNLIDSLRNANFIPYLKNKPGDQADTVGKLFNYTIPDSTFVDDDGNNTLTYTAKLLSGDSLPAWLAFDPVSRSFSGTPKMVGTLNLKVTATDNTNVSVATSFKLAIKESTAKNENDKQGVKIFPNPSSGRIRISLDPLPGKTASFEILNMAGQLVMKNNFTNEISIDLADKPKGMYIIKLTVDNEIIIRRICFI